QDGSFRADVELELLRLLGLELDLVLDLPFLLLLLAGGHFRGRICLERRILHRGRAGGSLRHEVPGRAEQQDDGKAQQHDGTARHGGTPLSESQWFASATGEAPSCITYSRSWRSQARLQ